MGICLIWGGAGGLNPCQDGLGHNIFKLALLMHVLIADQYADLMLTFTKAYNLLNGKIATEKK